MYFKRNKIRLHTLLFVFPQFSFTETLHVSAVVSHHQAQAIQSQYTEYKNKFKKTDLKRFKKQL
jgi:hypothetical protein